MVRIALAQVGSELGDVTGNVATARRQVERAASDGADLVVFPELFLHGYALGALPDDRSIPRDDERLNSLAGLGPDVLIGFHEDGGVRRYNSAVYLAGDGNQHLHRKLYPVNYLDWEERKHYSPGGQLAAFDTRFARVATLICNDAWQPVLPWIAAQDGAEVLLIPANSAADAAGGAVDTVGYWSELLRFIASMQQCWVVFCNRVGEESGARFWGGSTVLDPTGAVVARAPMWEPSLTLADIDPAAARERRHALPLLADARLGFVERAVHGLIERGGDL